MHVCVLVCVRTVYIYYVNKNFYFECDYIYIYI